MVLVNGEDACSGVVFVYSKDSRTAVSSAGWTDKESGRLCEDLSCGKEGTIEVGVGNKKTLKITCYIDE